MVLDNDTLYIDQGLAEALGWDRVKQDSVPLTLHGWGPTYFAIARTGSDSGRSFIDLTRTSGDMTDSCCRIVGQARC